MDSIDVYDESVNLTREEMWSLGLQPWTRDSNVGVSDEDMKKELWLFPFSFYEHIPAGFPIVFIDFEKGEFMPNVTDDDTRFGYLAFGVMGRLKK